jgi:ribokinase
MRFLVSGLINLETTLRVTGFPLHYNPVNYPFFGVQSRVSGVGYNLAKALLTLGHEVRFLSLIGQDSTAFLVQEALRRDQIPAHGVLQQLRETPQSVILYEANGRRQIHTDLKDVQEQAYPPERFMEALRGCDWAALCNINFSRPMLTLAAQAGVPIATDVHAITSLDDEYNQDFMAAAQVLFMSHENLSLSPEDWLRAVGRRFGTSVAVVGLGEQGALLGLRAGAEIWHVPAVFTRPVVNTIGAGDALFSAFLHGYAESGDGVQALRQAVVFASYKIGVASAAEGFLDAEELRRWVKQIEEQRV